MKGPRRPASRPRRAVALLLVLGALLVVTTAALVLVRVRSTAALERRIGHRTMHIDELLAAADDPVRAWLADESAKAVVSPDAAGPGLAILDDMIAFDGITAHVRIGAFDQHAMLPWDDARSASPLRNALPPSVRARVNDVPTSRRSTPGLDLLPRPREGEAVTFPIIPDMPQLEGQPPGPMMFGTPLSSDSPTTSADAAVPMDEKPPLPPAVGAWLATHTESPAEVNVNTAPPELLDEAMRRLGRGGFDAIIESRRQGKAMELPSGASQRSGPSSPLKSGSSSQAGASGQRTPKPPSAISGGSSGSPPHPSSQSSSPASASQRTRNQNITLVSSSRAWAFRVDVTIDGTSRSQWSVWTLGKDGWACAQRLEVTP